MLEALREGNTGEGDRSAIFILALSGLVGTERGIVGDRNVGELGVVRRT